MKCWGPEGNAVSQEQKNVVQKMNFYGKGNAKKLVIRTNRITIAIHAINVHLVLPWKESLFLQERVLNMATGMVHVNPVHLDKYFHVNL